MGNQKEKSLQLVHLLSDYANCNGSMKALVKNITNDHRTLQQWIFNLFLNTFIEWAQMYKQVAYDIRNEVACHMSYDICKYLGYID